jgi:hypothetical protein
MQWCRVLVSIADLLGQALVAITLAGLGEEADAAGEPGNAGQRGVIVREDLGEINTCTGSHCVCLCKCYVVPAYVLMQSLLRGLCVHLAVCRQPLPQPHSGVCQDAPRGCVHRALPAGKPAGLRFQAGWWPPDTASAGQLAWHTRLVILWWWPLCAACQTHEGGSIVLLCKKQQLVLHCLVCCEPSPTAAPVAEA